MPIIVGVIERIVAFSCSHARAVIACGLILAAAAAAYTVNAFAINTDSETLTSPDLPWRQAMARFDRLFPQRNNLVLVVIDSYSPERAQGAANMLAAKLASDPGNFPAVRRPDGGTFFERNGLLYMSEAEVRQATEQMIAAQPFLGAIASDPSLRGITASLDIMLMGVSRGEAKFADIDRPMRAFAGTLEQAAEGRTAYLPWSKLMAGGGIGGDRTRAFIEVQPKLDYNELSPGAKASERIRQAAKQLGLTRDKGVMVRLTGPVPLADEEFASLSENAEAMGLAMLLLIVLCLWMAVHSFRIIFCILITLGVGLTLTTALGLLAVGQFNILSVAFIALFVGLGVDFAIQFAVRYRSARYYIGGLEDALSAAGRRAGIPLALAAATISAGFFSFLPTDYTGVGELGVITGIGMLVAFALSITLLPALILAAKPDGEEDDIGFAAAAPIDDFLIRHRANVLIAAAGAAILAACAIPFLKFNSNPLDLRNRHVESVSTLYDLMKNPESSPYTIDVLAPSLDQAEAMAKRIEKSPLVGMALTLKSFVPENQEPKLAQIADAALLLDTTVNPFETKPAPDDAEQVRVLSATAKTLRAVAAQAKPEDAAAKKDALLLAAAMEAVAKAGPDARARAHEALIPGFQTLLAQIGRALQAEPVSLETIPKQMHDEWVAADGTARVSVFPKTPIWDNKALKRFSKAVLSVSHDATGAPITIEESGHTIVGAFLQAGLWSFLAITFLLFVTLKRWQDVAMAIAPLLLAALLTLATCVFLGLQLNFANIIALPLLFGIGVAFDIYYLIAWRAGSRRLIQSSLTRAMLFSALTTASGFGALVLSSHPGTASMGVLLMISLGWLLFTTMIFMPALLGPPPVEK